MVSVTNGASITSKRPARMLTEKRSVATRGARVTLQDGREYVDWQGGLRGDLYGYAPIWWQRAMYDVIALGPASSIACEDEITASNLLGEFYPDIEAVRWMMNGSDPCAAAVKLVRAVTGRDKLLVYGYHGQSSAYASPPTPFDPDDNRGGTLQAERDAYVSLDWLGDYQCLDNIAGVIIECPPIDGGLTPAADWLNKLALDAADAGALFVLDEVVTGFRYGPNGAAGYYGLEGLVDLYCFGKTLGNGVPISALAGKCDVMQWLATYPDGGGRVHFSGTWFGEPLGLAGAIATMRQLREQPPWDYLYKIGDYLKESWNGLGLPYRIEGHSTRPVVKGTDEHFINLRRHLFERGHIFIEHPLYVTMAHDTDDVDALCEAASGWRHPDY